MSLKTAVVSLTYLALSCTTVLAETCYRQEQTGTRQDCSTTSQQQCHDETSQNCLPTTRRECNPFDHQQCTPITRRECTPTTRRECSSTTRHDCHPIDRQQCSTVTRRVCDQTSHNECTTTQVCEDVRAPCPPPAEGQPPTACPQHVIHQCHDQQSCHDVPSQNCHDVPSQVCTTVHDTECREIPDQVCRDIPDQVCRDVPDQTCQIIHDTQCLDVPDQVCNTSTHSVCQQVPVQTCANVPVFEQVPYECGPSGGSSGTPTLSSAVIYINNVRLQAAKTYELNGHLLVPVRSLFESLGATVDYSDVDQKITAQYRGHTVVMKVGSSVASRDGQSIAIDAPPLNIGGSVYIPLRFAAESLQSQVNYVSESQSVFITTQ